MICKVCKKKYTDSTSKWCSRSCYFKSYYKKNKKKLLDRRKGWHKKYYKPHPSETKKTPEYWKEYRKKYYQEHKEYYQKKNKEYYEKHKNEEDFRKNIMKQQKNI